MSDFRESCCKKTIHNVICCLKVHKYITTSLRLKIVRIITQIQNKISPVIIKNNIYSAFLLMKYIVPTILIEWKTLCRIKSLDVIISRYQKQSLKSYPVKKVLSTILQISLKNIPHAVFNWIKFHAKGLQLYWKETPACVIY